MARYDDYKPDVLSKELMTDRNRSCVFRGLTYQGPILGDIKKMGDVLRIAGVGRPTVNSYTVGTDITLEAKQATNQTLIIDQAKYVNVEIEEIDDTQAVVSGKIMQTEVAQAREALNRTLDEHLAGLYAQSGNTTITDATCDEDSLLDDFMTADQYLMEADVPPGARKFLVISPAIYKYMWKTRLIYDTDNSELLTKPGMIGRWGNFEVYVSNSLTTNGSGKECMAFSDQAIALAEQIPPSQIKIFEPEAAFSKAFKVLHLYGSTVIRPKELVRLTLTPTA